MVSVYYGPAARGDKALEIGYGLLAHLTGDGRRKSKGVGGEGELRIEWGQSSEAAGWAVGAGTEFLCCGCLRLLPGELIVVLGRPECVIVEVAYAERSATTL